MPPLYRACLTGCVKRYCSHTRGASEWSEFRNELHRHFGYPFNEYLSVRSQTSPVTKNEAAIKEAKIKSITKGFTKGKLIHNKFRVLTDRGPGQRSRSQEPQVCRGPCMRGVLVSPREDLEHRERRKGRNDDNYVVCQFNPTAASSASPKPPTLIRKAPPGHSISPSSSRSSSPKGTISSHILSPEPGAV